MCGVLSELVLLLELEKIEEAIYRGRSQDLGFGSLFGGQILGQALSAAARSVDDSRMAHSLHAYFLRSGDVTIPTIYQIESLRDGRSFSTRRVTAVQKGRPILSMEASFHIQEEGFSHQAGMPEVPDPEDLISDVEFARKIKDQIPEPIRSKLTCDKPIEIRQVNPINPFKPDKRPAVKYSWFKAAGPLPDNPVIHQYLLTYASDFGLVGTALYPHGTTFWDPSMQVASLDHAIWFHRDFRMDDWLLYAMESPNASGARGLNRGKIFTRGGVLVASTAQEGLIRHRERS